MNQVLITRKIEVVINEKDPKMKKEMFAKLKKWRDIARKAANIIVSHKFIQKNVADFEYLTDETKQKILVSDIIKEGRGLSVQNVTYRILSQTFGKEVPSYMLSALNQAVSRTFNETYAQVRSGDNSLRSYKNDIPIPFPASALRKWGEEKDEITGKVINYSFVIGDIPFKTFLGRDKSQNKSLLSRCFDENDTNHKLRSFSLVIDNSKEFTKLFFLAVIQCPMEIIKGDKKKTLYAQLSVNTPIICSSNPAAIPYMSDYSMFENRQNLMELACQIKEFDKGLGEKTKKEIEDLYSTEKGKYPHIEKIGNKDEFLYRRIQIQRAVQRCQKDSRYSTGGKGRKKKCQAIERWHKIEHNYVETKMHTYARQLVQKARAQKCNTIVLCKQEENELAAKSAHKEKRPYLLRNWSYYGLKNKIEYKAALLGIELIEELSSKSLVVYFEGDKISLVKKFSNKINGDTIKVNTSNFSIKNIDKYDIVYIGMTGITSNIKDLIVSFVGRIEEGYRAVVPFVCSDDINQADIQSIESTFPQLSWWKEVVNLHKISDKEMKSYQEEIFNSMNL